MKRIVKIFGVIACSLLSTAVFAATVNIPTFTVNTSTSDKNIGRNTYNLVKSAYYTANVSSISGSSPSYTVRASDNSLFGVSFSAQTVATTNTNLSIRKTFTKNNGFSATLYFYVTGKSGSITNSATLS